MSPHQASGEEPRPGPERLRCESDAWRGESGCRARHGRRCVAGGTIQPGGAHSGVLTEHQREGRQRPGARPPWTLQEVAPRTRKGFLQRQVQPLTAQPSVAAEARSVI